MMPRRAPPRPVAIAHGGAAIVEGHDRGDAAERGDEHHRDKPHLGEAGKVREKVLGGPWIKNTASIRNSKRLASLSHAEPSQSMERSKNRPTRLKRPAAEHPSKSTEVAGRRQPRPSRSSQKPKAQPLASSTGSPGKNASRTCAMLMPTWLSGSKIAWSA